MKKIFIFFLPLLLSLVSCSTESTVKETAQDCIKKQLKDPTSFKLTSIEVREDTIPFYLNSELLTEGVSAEKAFDNWKDYSDRDDYLWAQEKLEAGTKFKEATNALQKKYATYKAEYNPTVQWVAYVKYTAKNGLGNEIPGREIVIIDKNDPKKVLGSYDVDNDFISILSTVLSVGSKFEFELKENQFGKYELDNQPYLIQFVFGD